MRILVLWMAGLLAGVPLAGAAERTLASEALAEAIQRGTLEEVRKEMVADLHPNKRYEFDEEGVQALGRKLFDQGDSKTAIEVLQLNQLFHGRSARASNALADAYAESGNPMMARGYYENTLKLDSENAHARAELKKLGTPPKPPTPEEALAQLGAQMSPEAAQQMQDMLRQIEQAAAGQEQRKQSAATPRGGEELVQQRIAGACAELGAKYEPFGGPAALARLTGQYGPADDPESLKTWNVESTCDGKALHAIPLWADVAPYLLTPVDRLRFSDIWDGTWEFRLEGSGTPESVTNTTADGKTQRLRRLGEPYEFE